MSKKKPNQKNPKSPNTSSPIPAGKVAFQNKDYDRAIELWEKATSNTPATQEALKQSLAEAYFRRGQLRLFESFAYAVADVEKAALTSPADALYAYHVGLAYHRQSHLSQAIQWYREALKRDPNFARAYFPLALAIAENGEDVTQQPVWGQLNSSQQEKIKGTQSDAVSQALLLIKQGKWDAADTALRTALTTNISTIDIGMAHYYLGIVSQRDGKLQDALTHWQQAFSHGLRMPYLRLNLASACVVAAETALANGDGNEANRWITFGLEVNPAQERLQKMQTSALLHKAYAAAQQGDWTEALNAWEKADKTDSSVARGVAANTALAYEKQERWEESADAWRDFAKRRGRKEGSETWLSPEQVARLWGRISALYMQAGDPDEAINTLQTALKHDSDNLILGIGLAQANAHAGRIEAAHNQVNRVLKKHPQAVAALVFKAELAENAPLGWYMPGEVTGIPEWRAVLETNDETYAPLARQKLEDLYIDALRRPNFFLGTDPRIEQAKEALELFPDHSYIRVLYIHVLLAQKKPNQKDIRSQVERIDLADWEALHALIDTWHTFERHKDAQETLERANSIKRLDAKFYVGIASCAMGREQEKISQAYIDTSLNIVQDEDERKYVLARIGSIYLEAEQEERAEQIWLDLLKKDPDYGPALYLVSQIDFDNADYSTARKRLKQAERWAKQHNDAELLESIQEALELLDAPTDALPPMPPEIINMLQNMDEDEREEFLDMLDNIDPSSLDLRSILGRRRRK